MAKYTPLADVGSLANTTSARQAINDNSDSIEAAFQNTLSRDGSAPNNMEADIDMDSHYVMNVADPVSPGDAVNLRTAQQLAVDAGSGDTAIRGDLIAEGGASLVTYKRIGVAGAVTQTLAQLLDMWVTPEQFGAVGDGVTSDIEAFRDACDYLSSLHNGGVLLCGSKDYLLDEGLVISGMVTIVGQGWSPYPGDAYGTRLLHYYDGVAPAYCIDFQGGGGGLIDIEQITTQDDVQDGSWTPDNATMYAVRVYRAPFSAGARHARFKNVMQRNFAKGILILTDQIEIDGLWGQWFLNAVDVAAAYDVCRIRDVHHWTFWSGDADVMAYIYANCQLIRSGRNDNPFFSDLFALHVLSGMHLYHNTVSANPTGGTSRCTVTNFGFDGCKYGFTTDGNVGVQVYASQGYILGNSAVESYGFFVQGAFDHFLISNVDGSSFGAGFVRATGASTGEIVLSNCRVRSWNQLNAGHAALQSVAGHRFLVGSTMQFDSGTSNGGAIANAASPAAFSGSLVGNIDRLTREFRYSGTLNGSGSATIDTSGETAFLHTRLLTLSGFAYDAGGLPDKLDGSQITVASSSSIAITAGAGYAGDAYRVYIKLEDGN